MDVMPSWMREMLSPSQFMPHGHCYLWQTNLVMLHVFSDVLIAIAYFSIPIMLIYFIQKREDVPFRGVFILFSVFIVTCGTTHLMSVWTLWHPAYWLSGLIKALTALVSAFTALTLLPTIPMALALPRPEALRQINQRLETEIEDRKQAEVALQYQLSFDRILSEISASFIGLALDDMDDEIERSLKTIGQFIQVDTSYIFQLDSATETLSMSHEWVAEGHIAQMDNAQKLPQAAFPWSIERLSEGQVLQVPSVVELPDAASMEKKNLQAFNLQSLICVPFMAQDQLLGWVGFASFQRETTWSESSLQLLTLLAEILTRALQRQQAERALRQSDARLQMALEAGKTICWEYNFDTQNVQGFGQLVEGIWQPTEWEKEKVLSQDDVYPADRERVRQALKVAIATNGEFALEHRLSEQVTVSSSVVTSMPSEGEARMAEESCPRWVLTKGKVLPGADGQSARIAALTVDVTDRKLAEDSLQESEERWQLALEAANDGIWDWNLKTDEVFYSDRFKEMLGFDATDEFPTHLDTWSKRVHPDDIDRVNADVQAHFEGKTPFYVNEHRRQCKDGSYKWVLVRAKAQRDEAGNAIRMIGSDSDITAQKQAEFELQQLNRELEARVEARAAELKKSEQRFRSLFESAPDFIYVLDQQGVIQQVNSTVLSRSGYEASDLLGQPFVTMLKPETSEVDQTELAQLLIAGDHHQEMEFVCKDGQILTMDCSCSVVKNDESESYVLVLQRDITQRKQAERERAELLATLQASEHRWQSFLSNVRMLVVSVDLAGNVEYMNPYFLDLMGCSQDDVIGQNWFDSFTPSAQNVMDQQAFQAVLSGDERSHYQSCIELPSGEKRVISWNGTLLQDAYGNPIGMFGIGEDITERDAVDRMKSEFISVVSHELRTPLTSIHGALDLLSGGLIDPQSDRGQHVFSIAVENSDRLVKLVNDILELERLESGKIKLHYSSISTQELMQRAYDLMELMAERAGITLALEKKDVLLWADSDRLIQVLTNLVGNAIKFSDAPATVWVAVEAVSHPAEATVADVVKFTVRDEGRGIPADKVEGIFERFHQVDASDSRRKGGTGLGLAICRSIVQQHGGNIWVESTLGEGSSFYFTIPKQAT